MARAVPGRQRHAHPGGAHSPRARRSLRRRPAPKMEAGHCQPALPGAHPALQVTLVDEGEIRDSPMARMRPPRVPETPVPVICDADLKKLLAECEGASFEDRGDSALVRMLLDSGLRAAELMNLRPDD